MKVTAHILIAILFFFTACGSEMDNGGMEASVESEEQANVVTPVSAPVAERKIVREANLRFQVDDLDKSESRIEALADKYNAIITDTRSYNASKSIEASYTIKVAPEKLFDLIRAIQSESIYLDNKSVSSQDVTRQYIDIEARIKAKQAARQRYLELIRQATKVEDILAVEVELRKVQEELEAIQAQLKALQQQVSYSTIHLTMYQIVPASYTDRTNFVTRITTALGSGWYMFKDLIVGTISLWPLVILAVLVALALRWQKRRRRGMV